MGGDGRTLVIMPPNFYQHLRNADLGAIIAYLKAVPPVDNDLGVRRVGFPGSVLGGTIGFNDFTRINGIDHANVGANSPKEGTTAEYGANLTQIAACGECHAPDLAGIPILDVAGLFAFQVVSVAVRQGVVYGPG